MALSSRRSRIWVNRCVRTALGVLARAVVPNFIQVLLEFDLKSFEAVLDAFGEGFKCAVGCGLMWIPVESIDGEQVEKRFQFLVVAGKSANVTSVA